MTTPNERLHVLVVDDSDIDRTILRRHLDAIPEGSFEVTEVAGPEQALAAAAEESFDVVFLDYNLGRESGLDVLTELHALDPLVPVIMITAGGDEEVAAAALRRDAADYLPKQNLAPRSLKRSLGNAVEKAAMRRSLIEHQEHLERTVEELRIKNEEIQNLYHSMAHELKTPLTGAKEFVSIVRDGLAGGVTPKQAEYLSTALASCERMVHCIDDMLDACRADAGKLKIATRPCSVGSVVDAVAREWAGRARSKGVVLEDRVPRGLPEVFADEHRLVQVVTNLVSNAIKFTERGGSVTIGAARREAADFLEVFVADTGRGIEPENRERIFERLYQIREGDAAVQGGLGLGLNISRNLIHLHGGEIRVDSTPGEGSRFTFTLPLAPLGSALRA